MPDTYTTLRVHLVWATKNRRPWLDPEWRARLFAHVAATVAARGGRLLCAGGVRDHIHLYVSLSPRYAIADVVNAVKSNTSRWIRQTFAHRRDFRWQTGYSAFTVTPRNDTALRDYIRNQETHHRERDFPTEHQALLAEHEPNTPPSRPTFSPPST